LLGFLFEVPLQLCRICVAMSCSMCSQGLNAGGILVCSVSAFYCIGTLSHLLSLWWLLCVVCVCVLVMCWGSLFWCRRGLAFSLGIVC
jgi:hypothetical protein